MIIIPSGEDYKVEEKMESEYIEDGTAVYHESEVTDYAGNPLIEALPRIMSNAEVNSQLSFAPTLPTELERNQPSHIRFHYPGRLRRFVYSLPEYSLYEPSVSMLIRRGYVGRNPASLTTWAKAWRINRLLTGTLRQPENTQPAETILFCGLSGTGKSTFINRLFASYPQVIQHTQYKDVAMRLQQVVWLKVNCPKSGTPTDLCKNFYLAIDRLLGTSYSEDVRSNFKSADYMRLMGRIASNHFLGALVLDELQNLSVQKSGGDNKLLDDLAQMFEILEIPIIFIGTPEVTKIFEKKLQNVRRSASLGSHLFDRPTSPDRIAWKHLLAGIWEYQWTKNKTKLTPSLSAAFYHHCQGITFFAVALFMQCQYRLINDDDDDGKITKALLEQIAATDFRLLQPALAELRKNDAFGFAAYEAFIDSLDENTMDKLVSAPQLANIPKMSKGKKTDSQRAASIDAKRAKAEELRAQLEADGVFGGNPLEY